MNITIYDKTTGRIDRIVNCLETDIPLQYTPISQEYLEGEYSDNVFYIHNKIPIRIPDQVSNHHIFNWQTKQWEDPRTVQDFKDAKWISIKEAREAIINAPLVTPYGIFDSDPKSRQNITDAILMLKSLEDLGSPTTIDFTLADDTARTLTTAEMVMVGLLLGQKIQAAHAQARALRGALDLATTKEEVEAITWQATT